MEALNGNFYGFTADDYYERLAAGSDNMSVDSAASLHMSNGGGSVTMTVAESSVGSNGSSRTILMHPELGIRRGNRSVTGSYSVVHPAAPAGGGGGAAGGPTDEDVLASALMDVRSPTEGLEGYDNWTLDLRRLAMGHAFAQGASGRLYRGTYDGEDVAVKILERPKNNAERAQVMEQQFTQEVRMLAALKHQNVVRFIGACRKPLVWCIVTEYAKGGSVRSFLSKRKSRPVPLKLAVKQALDIAQGMQYLHNLGFIHRDLKSDNLLIATDKSIKIADFGVARIEVQTEGMTPETGTYRWMAPEMIQHRLYTHKVDVYSFGIVLWELITGMLPFQNMTAVQAAFAVVNRGYRPGIPADCPPALAEIMSRCWDLNPDSRPGFGQVVKMLEEARAEIMYSVGRARFRCGCMARPLTND